MVVSASKVMTTSKGDVAEEGIAIFVWNKNQFSQYTAGFIQASSAKMKTYQKKHDNGQHLHLAWFTWYSAVETLSFG